jgi:hypothetical protein
MSVLVKTPSITETDNIEDTHNKTILSKMNKMDYIKEYTGNVIDITVGTSPNNQYIFIKPIIYDYLTVLMEGNIGDKLSDKIDISNDIDEFKEGVTHKIYKRFNTPVNSIYYKRCCDYVKRFLMNKYRCVENYNYIFNCHYGNNIPNDLTPTGHFINSIDLFKNDMNYQSLLSVDKPLKTERDYNLFNSYIVEFFKETNLNFINLTDISNIIFSNNYENKTNKNWEEIINAYFDIYYLKYNKYIEIYNNSNISISPKNDSKNVNYKKRNICYYYNNSFFVRFSQLINKTSKEDSFFKLCNYSVIAVNNAFHVLDIISNLFSKTYPNNRIKVFNIVSTTVTPTTVLSNNSKYYIKSLIPYILAIYNEYGSLKTPEFTSCIFLNDNFVKSLNLLKKLIETILCEAQSIVSIKCNQKASDETELKNYIFSKKEDIKYLLENNIVYTDIYTDSKYIQYNELLNIYINETYEHLRIIIKNLKIKINIDLAQVTPQKNIDFVRVMYQHKKKERDRRNSSSFGGTQPDDNYEDYTKPLQNYIRLKYYDDFFLKDSIFSELNVFPNNDLIKITDRIDFIRESQKRLKKYEKYKNTTPELTNNLYIFIDRLIKNKGISEIKIKELENEISKFNLRFKKIIEENNPENEEDDYVNNLVFNILGYDDKANPKKKGDEEEEEKGEGGENQINQLKVLKFEYAQKIDSLFKERNEEQDKIIKELLKKIEDNIKSKIDELKGNPTSSESEKIQEHSNSFTLYNENKELRQENKELRQENKELNDKLIEYYKNYVETINSIISQNTESIFKLLEKLNGSSSTKNDGNSETEILIQTLSEKFSKLIENSEKLNESLTKQADNKSQETVILSETISTISVNNNRAIESITDTNAEVLKTIAGILAHLQPTKDTSQENVEPKYIKYENLQESFSDLKSEISKLQSQISELQKSQNTVKQIVSEEKSTEPYPENQLTDFTQLIKQINGITEFYDTKIDAIQIENNKDLTDSIKLLIKNCKKWVLNDNLKELNQNIEKNQPLDDSNNLCDLIKYILRNINLDSLKINNLDNCIIRNELTKLIEKVREKIVLNISSQTINSEDNPQLFSVPEICDQINTYLKSINKFTNESNYTIFNCSITNGIKELISNYDKYILDHLKDIASNDSETIFTSSSSNTPFFSGIKEQICESLKNSIEKFHLDKPEIKVFDCDFTEELKELIEKIIEKVNILTVSSDSSSSIPPFFNGIREQICESLKKSIEKFHLDKPVIKVFDCDFTEELKELIEKIIEKVNTSTEHNESSSSDNQFFSEIKDLIHPPQNCESEKQTFFDELLNYLIAAINLNIHNQIDNRIRGYSVMKYHDTTTIKYNDFESYKKSSGSLIIEIENITQYPTYKLNNKQNIQNIDISKLNQFIELAFKEIYQFFSINGVEAKSMATLSRVVTSPPLPVISTTIASQQEFDSTKYNSIISKIESHNDTTTKIYETSVNNSEDPTTCDEYISKVLYISIQKINDYIDKIQEKNDEIENIKNSITKLNDYIKNPGYESPILPHNLGSIRDVFIELKRPKKSEDLNQLINDLVNFTDSSKVYDSSKVDTTEYSVSSIYNGKTDNIIRLVQNIIYYKKFINELIDLKKGIKDEIEEINKIILYKNKITRDYPNTRLTNNFLTLISDVYNIQTDIKYIHLFCKHIKQIYSSQDGEKSADSKDSSPGDGEKSADSKDSSPGDGEKSADSKDSPVDGEKSTDINLDKYKGIIRENGDITISDNSTYDNSSFNVIRILMEKVNNPKKIQDIKNNLKYALTVIDDIFCIVERVAFTQISRSKDLGRGILYRYIHGTYRYPIRAKYETISASITNEKLNLSRAQKDNNILHLKDIPQLNKYYTFKIIDDLKHLYVKTPTTQSGVSKETNVIHPAPPFTQILYNLINFVFKERDDTKDVLTAPENIKYIMYRSNFFNDKYIYHPIDIIFQNFKESLKIQEFANNNRTTTSSETYVYGHHHNSKGYINTRILASGINYKTITFENYQNATSNDPKLQTTEFDYFKDLYNDRKPTYLPRIYTSILYTQNPDKAPVLEPNISPKQEELDSNKLLIQIGGFTINKEGKPKDNKTKSFILPSEISLFGSNEAYTKKDNLSSSILFSKKNFSPQTSVSKNENKGGASNSDHDTLKHFYTIEMKDKFINLSDFIKINTNFYEIETKYKSDPRDSKNHSVYTNTKESIKQKYLQDLSSLTNDFKTYYEKFKNTSNPGKEYIDPSFPEIYCRNNTSKIQEYITNLGPLIESENTEELKKQIYKIVVETANLLSKIKCCRNDAFLTYLRRQYIKEPENVVETANNILNKYYYSLVNLNEFKTKDHFDLNLIDDVPLYYYTMAQPLISTIYETIIQKTSNYDKYKSHLLDEFSKFVKNKGPSFNYTEYPSKDFSIIPLLRGGYDNNYSTSSISENRSSFMFGSGDAFTKNVVLNSSTFPQNSFLPTLRPEESINTFYKSISQSNNNKSLKNKKQSTNKESTNIKNTKRRNIK